MRKIGERIHPTPTFSIVNGELHCKTVCLGAKPVIEVLVPGETTFREPNLSIDYTVTSCWEGASFTATRQSLAVNKGRPTVQRRWVCPTTGRLVIKQDWGGKKIFTAYFSRKSVKMGVYKHSSARLVPDC
jgi:hypothetical protein